MVEPEFLWARPGDEWGASAEQLLCQALVRAGSFTGAGAALISHDRGERFELATTDLTFQALAEAQFTVWEGPGPEAFESGEAVATSDITTGSERWPLLTAALSGRNLPARAHAVVPLTHDGSVVGLLGVYRSDDRDITGDDLGLLAAFATTTAAIAVRRGAETEGDPWGSQGLPHARTAVAAGMVVAYFDIAHDEATARLRAHAFTSGTTLARLSAALVARELPISALDQPG